MSHNPVALAEELIHDIEKQLDNAEFSPERVNSGVVSYL